MKKYFIIFAGVFFIPLLAFCQHWEVGVMLGASNYSGDLSEAPITLGETHFAGGGLVRYNFTDGRSNNHWTLKGNAYYGYISGNDSNASTQKHRARKLSFRSEVLDIGANIEYNLLGFQSGGRKNHFTPYIFAGVAVFHFNPEAYYSANSKESGGYIQLQPLGTEGQGTTNYNSLQKYNLTQISIPFGFGIKWNVYDNWNIGAEFGWRKTFTDYLDDVSGKYPTTGYLQTATGSAAAEHLSNPAYWSTKNPDYKVSSGQALYRGDPTTNDWYIFTGITITYTFLPSICFQF